ncbi:MAG: superfamily II DNA or RNA helicase/HKD family nuclease [Paracoccaceae bacterium]|jgi:superfamily II DNA or RNA helicase/HKD family nuclease
MTVPLQPGLYERLLDAWLGERLAASSTTAHEIQATVLDPAVAADRLALHFSAQLERAINDFPEKDRARLGVELTRALIERLSDRMDDEHWLGARPEEGGRVLEGVRSLAPDGTPVPLVAPATPLLDTTLLTNAPGEPRMLAQIASEFPSAHGVEVVMAFIRRSGLRPLRSAIARHCGMGRPMRVLTTTFTGSTELRALEELNDVGANVRVSYDTSSTRLHAKSWRFERHDGVSTAYVGSSNWTHAGQVTGLEWNVRASSARNADVVNKLGAVFESYWEGGDFVPFERGEFERQSKTPEGGTPTLIPATELRLEPFQERLLEQIAIARAAGRTANLLVSATGTGKTVMAAVDYARSCRGAYRPRLLFVAHRKELLQQSRNTFRHALRDSSFGELWVDGDRPLRWEHVFASIQSLRANGQADLDRDHFEIVIVDEFHHASADSYTTLLDHVQPAQLLGLTATPERADGLSVLDRFGGVITAELRLWDAIEQQSLVPFLYYGIHDGTDLTQVGWTRGRGYDVEGLTNIYTADDRVAGLVLDQVCDRVEDVGTMRALGFCVSVDHARFMSRVFNERGVPSLAVWGNTPSAERHEALRQLHAGEIRVLFSVDLFNEGVDIPTVDTLLMLRPTMSGTLFLQQLGRGLRKAHGKSSCLVLDFVGQHRREFRFDKRYRALLGGTRRTAEKAIECGFPLLPAGCHMELEPAAQAVVLASLRNALPATWHARVAELRALVDAEGSATSLSHYLEETGLDLTDIYTKQGRCWAQLCEDAGVALPAHGPDENLLRRGIGRLLHVNDRERIDTYLEWLTEEEPPRLDGSDVKSREVRLARMLSSQLYSQGLRKGAPLADALHTLWLHPAVLFDLRELLAILAQRIPHLQPPIQNSHPYVPLRIHAAYSRLEILAAFQHANLGKVPAWQTGIFNADLEGADLLAFTLDKSSSGFSPTTRYRDYAVSRDLIHWESQSVTRADSPTGQRYQRHAAAGRSIMLFARENAASRAFWFLGPATYVRHEGERPMAINWRLHHPLPGDLFAAFAAAVA